MESNAANTTPKSAAKKRNYVSNLVFASVFVALAVLLKISFEIYFTPQLRFNFCNVPIMMSGIFLGPVWGFAVGAVTDIVNYLIKPAGAMHWGFTLSSALTGCIPGIIFVLTKKKRKHDKLLFSLLNIANYVILIGGLVLLFQANGLLKFENDLLYIAGTQISWILFAVILLLFAIYALSLIFLLGRKENEKTVIPAYKIIFAVALVEIVCSLILNTNFLADLYGMAALALLPMRLLKSIIVIPIFSFACFALCNLFARYKLQKNK